MRPIEVCWVIGACCVIHVCIAIPDATPALMERVEPNWAMERHSASNGRIVSESPGPS